MTYKKEICKGSETFKGCEKDKYIVNRTKKLCSDCNSKRLKKSKSVQKTEKGELQLFIQIWNERTRISEVSGKPLGQFNICYFSHILPKGKYPAFRLRKENIILKTVQEHFDWHSKAESDLIKKEMWIPIFEKRNELLVKYNLEINI